MPEDKYKMTINLNVLNHLGINLYSNIPAVLSEVVSNSWDADANLVDIILDSEQAVITIFDNGIGMTIEDINNKYLCVGYERRKENGEKNEEGQLVTSRYKRPIMGRKGIGKLSLFSIANTIEIHTMHNGEKNGFILSAQKIKELLGATHNAEYHPEPLHEDAINISKQGTKIVIKDFKRDTGRAADALKKRLARRFSIIGDEYNFVVKVNGEAITVLDRDYFHKIQYLWHYGNESEEYINYCHNLKANEKRAENIQDTDYKVRGWIGSVEKSGSLQEGEDNLNKIIIVVRGKVAQEDVLEDFAEGGMYTKYLIGEIQADFLDRDEEEESATTSRQEIKKEDPRYIELKKWVQSELKYIQSRWTHLRNETGTEIALMIPAIESWFKELGQDNQKKARILFGKINQLTVETENERRELLKYGVLAFESFRYKENLEALDKITPENIQQLTHIFANYDDIEATLYYQITKGRIKVIETLQEKTTGGALEKVIQEHLYDHLWLLDPSWERGTETPLMEQSVKKAWKDVDASLTKEEKSGRFDIKYKNPYGKHVIIELKKADRVMNDTALMAQIYKYQVALSKILQEMNKGHEPIEGVCLVGKKLKEWTNETEEHRSRESLKAKNIRVILYNELIENAYNSYKDYLKKKEDTGRVTRLIENIESFVPK